MVVLCDLAIVTVFTEYKTGDMFVLSDKKVDAETQRRIRYWTDDDGWSETYVASFEIDSETGIHWSLMSPATAADLANTETIPYVILPFALRVLMPAVRVADRKRR